MSIRSDGLKVGLAALLAAGLAVALMLLLFPGTGGALVPAPGPVVRLAATFDYSGEVSTNNGPGAAGSGGRLIYNRDVFPPSNANTLYVTFSGTGDSHFGTTTQLACLVDGHTCPNDFDSEGQGWTRVQKFNPPCQILTTPAAPSVGDGDGGCGDWHDNNVNLTWCESITPGSGHKNVQVKLASGDDESNVYVENTTILVDAAFTPHGCDFVDMGGVDSPSPGSPAQPNGG